MLLSIGDVEDWVIDGDELVEGELGDAEGDDEEDGEGDDEEDGDIEGEEDGE